jgi:4-amino-4-deoxy-L-arabinose transferase-like glycosyltransferase
LTIPSSFQQHLLRPSRLWDGLWLLLLAIFVFAGTMLAPFHGDEAMHIYTSKDYATAFIEGQPDKLLVNPPYNIDSDPRLRLLNGSVMRYSVGLAWQLAGLSKNDLPPAPGWDWGLYYDQNVSTGHRPSDTLLSAARVVSSLYLVASIIAMFGIGWQFKGRWMAWLVSGLYTLNPIILLNGRRALVESALLCFGLLLMGVALRIAHKRANSEPVGWGWWIGLVITSALTLASKYSGTIFVAAAFGGIFIADVIRFIQSWKFAPLRNGTAALFGSGLLAMGLLIALSPALWSDPIARAQDLGAMLAEQVQIVVDIQPDAPTTIGQRIEGMVNQPFIAAPQFFEQASWADAAPITAEIQNYMNSPLSGIQFGRLFGILLTLLTEIGIIAALWPRLRPYSSWGLSAVVIVWLLVTIANLLINPLPWQRYYLALIPLDTLLAGIGLFALLKFTRRENP